MSTKKSSSVRISSQMASWRVRSTLSSPFATSAPAKRAHERSSRMPGVCAGVDPLLARDTPRGAAMRSATMCVRLRGPAAPSAAPPLVSSPTADAARSSSLFRYAAPPRLLEGEPGAGLLERGDDADGGMARRGVGPTLRGVGPTMRTDTAARRCKGCCGSASAGSLLIAAETSPAVDAAFPPWSDVFAASSTVTATGSHDRWLYERVSGDEGKERLRPELGTRWRPLAPTAGTVSTVGDDGEPVAVLLPLLAATLAVPSAAAAASPSARSSTNRSVALGSLERRAVDEAAAAAHERR